MPDDARRVGFIVPPANPTLEPELRELLGTALDTFVARFPPTPGRDLHGMLSYYNEVVPEAIDGFDGMELSGQIISCTGSHYLLGPEKDEKLAAELSDRAGYPVVPATQALLAYLTETRVSSVFLVSPYEPWLTNVAERYWREAGVEVEGTMQLGAEVGFNPYAITAQSIRDNLLSTEVPENTTFLFSGTGMRTLAVMRDLRRDGRLAISSNLASAVTAHRLSGNWSSLGAKKLSDLSLFGPTTVTP
ncbi:arylmalonate decarboxylase [Brevibacterium sp. XM4083]|uniref:aspartate racemase/maleate isomerase family protein n=1 Tax=Brevibacterium sp. XM4083 TaxID=2583238 RepID=UPI00112B9FBA|nr:arylmalonate decarboxylase [Brevibacterium sp. XM4083]MCM1011808.1 hypothetical protein [Brevibacterium sp. XM4083]